MTMLWAGKQLSKEEDTQLRWVIDLLARCGDTKGAENFIRFLPEYEHEWTEEELNAGKETGPHLDFDATIEE